MRQFMTHISFLQMQRQYSTTEMEKNVRSNNNKYNETEKKTEELTDSNVNITTKVTQKPNRTIEKERY